MTAYECTRRRSTRGSLHRHQSGIAAMLRGAGDRCSSLYLGYWARLSRDGLMLGATQSFSHATPYLCRLCLSSVFSCLRILSFRRTTKMRITAMITNGISFKTNTPKCVISAFIKSSSHEALFYRLQSNCFTHGGHFVIVPRRLHGTVRCRRIDAGRGWGAVRRRTCPFEAVAKQIPNPCALRTRLLYDGDYAVT